MKITARAPRKEYERRIAPRSLFRILLQKLLHQWARGCIPAFLRLRLYRAMGVAIGGNVFVGLDTWLDDQFPELIEIEDDVTISFRVTVVVHDDARRMNAVIPGALDGTVAPVLLKRGCYLGACCIILPGVTVGERAVVGAGAVVTRDVPPGKIVLGVPARVVRDVG
ncbi:MAG: acyltransferase [Candidatus Eisenbacteria bacterium]|uniref:Acyltransferase n=1 Tax=Eiseniibacteriota bacterium TaxID=2212470 RepID=A0A538T043_UNCEI|nr:MAG: acyltransferase [Candidatus Eisenbacteria bacterium]